MEITVQLVIKWIVMILSAIFAIFEIVRLVQLILNSNRHDVTVIIAVSLFVLASICGFLGAYKDHLLCLIICFVGCIVASALVSSGHFVERGYDVGGGIIYLILVAIYAFIVHQNGGTIHTSI